MWLVPPWCAMPPLDISPTTKFVPTWYQQKIISPWACKRRGVNEYGVLIHGVAYIVRGGRGYIPRFYSGLLMCILYSHTTPSTVTFVTALCFDHWLASKELRNVLKTCRKYLELPVPARCCKGKSTLILKLPVILSQSFMASTEQNKPLVNGCSGENHTTIKSKDSKW